MTLEELKTLDAHASGVTNQPDENGDQTYVPCKVVVLDKNEEQVTIGMYHEWPTESSKEEIITDTWRIVQMPRAELTKLLKALEA